MSPVRTAGRPAPPIAARAMSCTRSRRARCGPVPRRSGAGPRRCSATSSPSTCSACRDSRSSEGDRTVEFALTDEQRALQDTVRSYLRDRFDLAAVRGVYDDPEGNGNPDELWKALAEQGWLAVLIPEEHDGLGLGLLDAAVIVRCLGAGV